MLYSLKNYFYRGVQETYRKLGHLKLNISRTKELQVDYKLQIWMSLQRNNKL